MLCPEVWNFPVSKNNITITNGILDDKRNKFVENAIVKHPFNELVSIILPEVDTVPSELRDLVDENDYYIVQKVRLVEFLRRDFIEAFVKRGSLSALSSQSSNEIDDAYAINSHGVLTLLVSKDVYHTLGLEGRLAHNSIKSKDKYVIEINLQNAELVPGSNYLVRLKTALSNSILSPVSMNICWSPPNETLCPSSIAKYFSDLGYDVEQCQLTTKVQKSRNFRLPSDSGIVANDDDQVHQLVECVGLSLLSCDAKLCDELSNPLVTTAGSAEDIQLVINCKGFLSTDTILKIYHCLRRTSKSFVLNVSGFKSTPISWIGCDHSFSTTNGDNDYLIVKFSDEKCLFYKNVASNKLLK